MWRRARSRRRNERARTRHECGLANGRRSQARIPRRSARPHTNVQRARGDHAGTLGLVARRAGALHAVRPSPSRKGQRARPRERSARWCTLIWMLIAQNSPVVTPQRAYKASKHSFTRKSARKTPGHARAFPRHHQRARARWVIIGMFCAIRHEIGRPPSQGTQGASDAPGRHGKGPRLDFSPPWPS